MSSLVLSNAHKLNDNPFIYGEEQNETDLYWTDVQPSGYPEAKRNVDKKMENEAKTPWLGDRIEISSKTFQT